MSVKIIGLCTRKLQSYSDFRMCPIVTSQMSKNSWLGIHHHYGMTYLTQTHRINQGGPQKPLHYLSPKWWWWWASYWHWYLASCIWHLSSAAHASLFIILTFTTPHFSLQQNYMNFHSRFLWPLFPPQFPFHSEKGNKTKHPSLSGSSGYCNPRKSPGILEDYVLRILTPEVLWGMFLFIFPS